MNELGPLPEVHPRVFICQKAGNELSSCLLELQQRHDLTSCEVLILLNEMEARTLKYALRAERHPDEPERPAGWK